MCGLRARRAGLHCESLHMCMHIPWFSRYCHCHHHHHQETMCAGPPRVTAQHSTPKSQGQASVGVLTWQLQPVAGRTTGRGPAREGLPEALSGNLSCCPQGASSTQAKHLEVTCPRHAHGVLGKGRPHCRVPGGPPAIMLSLWLLSGHAAWAPSESGSFLTAAQRRSTRPGC